MLGEVRLAGWFLLMSGVVACGNVSAEAGGLPTSDGGTDAEAGVDALACVIPPQTEYLKPNRVIGQCPALGSACANFEFSGAPLLTADEIAPNTSFLAVSGDLVLAEELDTDGTQQPVVVSLSSFSSDPFSILPFGVTLLPGERGVDLDGQTVLLCDGNDCRLDTVGPAEPVLTVSGVPTPTQSAPVGVVEWRYGERVCVYGNGLHCFDGNAWRELVPADSGPRFNAAAVTTNSIWAAGDGGRVVLATTECWRELDSGTSVSFRSLSADSYRELWAVATGDSGVVAYLGLEETITCSMGDATTTVLRNWGENWGYLSAAGQDDQWLFQSGGAVIRGKPAIGGDWCSGQLPDTVLDATWFNCGVAENERVITSHALLGTRFCALD